MSAEEYNNCEDMRCSHFNFGDDGYKHYNCLRAEKI